MFNGNNKWYVAIAGMTIASASYYWLMNRSVSDSVMQPPTLVQASSPASGWQSVAIGGGGYITGIYPHPMVADLVYVRTDNGGFYRWQKDLQQWLPITDSLPRGFWDYDHNSGGEAIALDPHHPNTVYIAVGKYTSQPGTVFKSLDRGETWQKSDLAVGMGGDQDKRWAGDRLVVNPFDPNVLLFGSRKDGLWRSLDGGSRWTQVSSLPISSENEIGILNVAFDRQQQNVIYASIYDDGVYQSVNNGQTWDKLDDSPRKVMKLEVAADSVVYATNSESPQVSQYVAGRWINISPQKFGLTHKIYNGLSLHPQDPATLIVSEGEKGKSKIYYSTDRGNSWQRKKATLNKNIPWLAKEFFNDHPSAIVFDPSNPQKVWLTDWFSVWHTDNIDESTVEWTDKIQGIEQTVLFTLVSPPKGPVLLSGLADQDGFSHQDLKISPHSRLGFERQEYSLNNFRPTGDRYLDNYFQDTLDIAYCNQSPQTLVRLGGQRWREAYMGTTSNDGGKSWQPWQNIPSDRLFMRVAISADNCDRFVVTTSEDLPLVTDDGGKSWQNVTGLPPGETGPWNWNKPLAADGVQSERFYYYDGAGKVYLSNDGGKSFQPTVTNLPVAERFVLTTVPGVAGEIWLSLDAEGLYRSTDGGKSFNKVREITQAHLVTVGKPINQKYTSSVYVYGKHNNRSGLFVSLNGVGDWRQINTSSEIPRSIKVLSASHQQPGLVFAGTDGRGIYYQQINVANLHPESKNQP